MTEVVLYHHVQGLTDGIRSFGDELRKAGHIVHTPDLFDGRTFDTIEAGMGFARETGFSALVQRGVTAAEAIGRPAVYAGFSFGVMVAQQLAQTLSDARGALLFSAALPASEFGGSWPQGVPLQIHMMEEDEFAVEDLPAARELVQIADSAQLFVYPGAGHLFADNSLPDYDETATELLKGHVLTLLADLD
jgi:dienelactone hydrolase